MDALDTPRDLYPEIEPFMTGRFRVDDRHELYVEQCGRRDGPAIVVLHGGPGGACSPAMRRFFNPEHWRVVLFDQRGCGRSRPQGSLIDNTTPHLVADLETLRENLEIDRWALFGGSWGSTLAVAYAQAHRSRVSGAIVRGVFLLTPEELDWFYGGGAGALLPEAWAAFLSQLDDDERDAPLPAYYARLTGEDKRVRARAARAWTRWETAALCAGRSSRLVPREPDAGALDTLARIECHYFHHGGFLPHPHALLEKAGALSGLPGAIIQGRLDFITPPRAAWRLSQAWPEAHFSVMDQAGHAASEPAVIDALVRATDRLARILV